MLLSLGIENEDNKVLEYIRSLKPGSFNADVCLCFVKMIVI